jgi:competence protein ComEC
MLKKNSTLLKYTLWVPVKRLSRFFALCVLLLGTLQLRADTVWVHHIGVGQGDATLIVAYQYNSTTLQVDTTSILIDAGNSSGKGEAVFDYINTELGTIKHLNYIITSHLHSDHIGGMPAVIAKLSINKWRVDYIIDRGAQFEPSEDECYSPDGFVDNDPVQPFDLPGSKIYLAYEEEIKKFYPNKRFNPAPGIDLFRELKRPLSMSMLLVASNGCTLIKYGSSFYQCPYVAKPDENDFSYAFLFSFQGFKYFTAGDLGGAPPYLDLETPLVDYFKTYPDKDFHFCTYKASHHGSINSNNEVFINYVKPTLTIIPSALRSFSGTQLPGLATLNRLANVGSTILYTYVYNTNPYSGTVSDFKDVKFVVVDPGYDQNIAIQVYSRNRSKSSPYGPEGAFINDGVVTCKKSHGLKK